MPRKKFFRFVEKAVENGFSVWWKFALSRTKGTDLADDAVQDAIFRTIKAEPDVESEEEAYRYISTVVRTTSVKTVGATYRPTRTTELIEERLPAREQEFGRSPLDVLLDAERQSDRDNLYERVMREFQQLPEELQQAVELHVMREPPMRLREIAQVQGVAISTVHDRVNRGLRVLGQAIVEKPPDE